MEYDDCRKTKKRRTVVIISIYINGEPEEEYMFYAPSHKQDSLVEQLHTNGYKRAYNVSYFEHLVEEREQNLNIAKAELNLAQAMLEIAKEHPLYEEPIEQEFRYEI